MNLELIKKYEKEFLHMLHGKTLLSRVMTSDEDEDDGVYTIWYEVYAYNDMKKWSPDYLFALNEHECKYYKPQFIINDEYVEFRKALAEGKTIQCNARESENDINYAAYGHSWWVDTTEFKYATCFYRIKPEEPGFKVGDYVRYIHTNSLKPLQIKDINCERYYFENAEIILRVDEIEKWEPREGEICVFWDSLDTGAVISKFSHIKQEKYATDLYTWNNCMPFTGRLPPHMKDSK